MKILEKIKIKELNLKLDERGFFLKIFDGTEDFRKKLMGDVYFVCGYKSKRGNHFHKKTNEWFCVVKGCCKLSLECVISGEVVTLCLSEKEPKIIYVPNNIAHVFYSNKEEDFLVIAFTDTIFDKNDTIPFEVKI